MFLRYTISVTFLLSCHLFYGTHISIFNDDSQKPTSKSNPILYELHKTIQYSMQSSICAGHIFMKSSLWQTYNKKLPPRRQKSLFKDWKVYDTGIGLIYLKHRSTTKKIGIKTNICKKLKLSHHITTNNKEWVTQFSSLFNLKQWHQYHKKRNLKVSAYIIGHGSKRTQSISSEFMCSLSAPACAQLLHFFNTCLQINLLSVFSCYWPAPRVLELMQKAYGYPHTPFSIITPLRTEESIWGGSETKPLEYCFNEAVQHIIQCYHGTITPHIRDIVSRIDLLHLKKNTRQGITFINPHSTFTQPI